MVLLTIRARSWREKGFITKALMPIWAAFSSLIRSLYPVVRIMGRSGRTVKISFARLAPVMFGMVISVITRSKQSGLGAKRFQGVQAAVTHRYIITQSRKDFLTQ